MFSIFTTSTTLNFWNACKELIEKRLNYIINLYNCLFVSVRFCDRSFFLQAKWYKALSADAHLAGGIQGIRAPALFWYSLNCTLKFLNQFRRNALKNQFKKRKNPSKRSTNSILLKFFDAETWFSLVRLIYSHSLLHKILSNRTGANAHFLSHRK